MSIASAMAAATRPPQTYARVNTDESAAVDVNDDDDAELSLDGMREETRAFRERHASLERWRRVRVRTTHRAMRA